jgi:hypothetical protein
MADAGYGLPDASQGLDSWWQRNLPSKDQVAKALGSLGAAKNAAGEKKPAPAPSMPAAIAAAPLGKGSTSLDNIVNMLRQRQQALMASATGGVGAVRPGTGLLGM